MLLPQKLGSVTLMRKLGSDGVAESFVGILDEPAGQQVVVRRLQKHILDDPSRLSTVEARLEDLTAVRHPSLLSVLRHEALGPERLVFEEHLDAVSLAEVIAWCKREGRTLPPNVFLHVATQICNGLEALHGRPGKASGAENVLHLALGPSAVLLSTDGRVCIGEYGLVRSPTALPSGGADDMAARLSHLSPEQTHPDRPLTPASDIFALGSLLYELLLLEPLFRRDSSLQTIHAVRQAVVGAALQQVKAALPGLDKVLYRALSLNPRHRYQRAFVLREDVRGLMAGFSFTQVADELRTLLNPLFAARAELRGETPPPADTRAGGTGAAGAPGQDDTMAFLRKAAAGDAGASAAAGGAVASDDELDGLEMWSEVPTSVDPTDPEGRPTTTPAGAPPRQETTGEANPAEPDRTTWIKHSEPPAEGAFDADESTEVGDAPAPRAVTPGGTKRQLSPDEARALGLQVRPTPEPAPRRGMDTIPTSFRDVKPDEDRPSVPDPGATPGPLRDRPVSPATRSPGAASAGPAPRSGDNLTYSGVGAVGAASAPPAPARGTATSPL